MSPSFLRRPLVAVTLLASLVAGGAALAQEIPVPTRHEGFVFVPPDGPSVLDATVLGPAAPALRPDLARPAVPVAQVMNGGGFGYTGFEYYNDQLTEGRLGARRRPREYVVAPSYVVPPRR